MNEQPEYMSKKVQQNAFENVSVNGNLSLESLTQIINLIPQSYNPTNSFCGVIEWIYKESGSIKKFPPCYSQEVLDIIRISTQNNISKELDFTNFEIEVLDLVFNYCYFFLQSARPRSQKFSCFTKEDYYLYLKKLINSGNKIRQGHIKLSSIITDTEMSVLVKKLEQTDD